MIRPGIPSSLLLQWWCARISCHIDSSCAIQVPQHSHASAVVFISRSEHINLELLLEPPPCAVSAISDIAKAEYEGLQYEKFMLLHMDRSPYAAIAPVTLLWHPVPKELQSEQPIGSIQPEECQVWVWVHAAAFDETFLCLQTACERQARHVIQLGL